MQGEIALAHDAGVGSLTFTKAANTAHLAVVLASAAFTNFSIFTSCSVHAFLCSKADAASIIPDWVERKTINTVNTVIELGWF